MTNPDMILVPRQFLLDILKHDLGRFGLEAEKLLGNSHAAPAQAGNIGLGMAADMAMRPIAPDAAQAAAPGNYRSFTTDAPLPSPRADVVTPKDRDGDTLAKIAARQQAPFPLFAPVSMDEIRALRDWMLFASADREYLLAALARKPSRAEVVEECAKLAEKVAVDYGFAGGSAQIAANAIRALASNRTGEST